MSRINERQTRAWLAPNGAKYTVTLEPLRRLFEANDRRRLLTFRSENDHHAIERVQLVAEDFDLEAASDEALVTLLWAR